MNFAEACEIVEQLHVFQGKIMKPFLAPVNNFIIVPAKQHEFDQMFKDMQDNKTSLGNALLHYQNDVTILVCFDFTPKGDEAAYCQYDYFMFDNNISAYKPVFYSC